MHRMGKKWGVENWKTRFPIHPLSSFSFSQSFLLVVYAIITVREKRDGERSICISSIITIIVVVNTHSLVFGVPLQKQDTEGGGERELAG